MKNFINQDQYCLFDEGQNYTAEQFNIWCHDNGYNYRLNKFLWPEGSIEWNLELINHNVENAITIYGTGQENEAKAVMLAFAFILGAEWQQSFNNNIIDNDTEKRQFSVPDNNNQQNNSHIINGNKTSIIQNKLDNDDNKDVQELSDKTKIISDFFAKNNFIIELVSRNIGVVLDIYEFRPSHSFKYLDFITKAETLAQLLQTDSIRIYPIIDNENLSIEIPYKQKCDIAYQDFIKNADNIFLKDIYMPIILGMQTNGSIISCSMQAIGHIIINGYDNNIISLFNIILYSILQHTSYNFLAINFDYNMKNFFINNFAEEQIIFSIKDLQKFIDNFDKQNAYWSKSLFIFIDQIDYLLQSSQNYDLLDQLFKLIERNDCYIIAAINNLDNLSNKVKILFDTRICFKINNIKQSREFLGYQGAECLLSYHDFLYKLKNNNYIIRGHLPSN